jgi:pimeloyl-ACP methyl ester carboxylesterase
VYVDSPSLRSHYVARGFAWAASSYQTNGYDVDQGVFDSYALIGVFREVTGTRPESVLMTGSSMGGHVTAVAIERYPRAFAGAMPVCGVLGDVELFDYFLDANLTAAALAGVDVPYPTDAVTWRALVGAILPVLSSTTAGRTWADVVERRSGGERPGFDAAFAYWTAARALPPFADLPFLFGMYPGVTGAPVHGNRTTFYRSTDRLLPTFAEWRLNAAVQRVPATGDLDAVPRVAGRPPVPVVSLHDLGDLFVPFSMEQVYAARAALHGRSRLVVSRAIRGVGHCDFTRPEVQTAFDDLVTWVDGGRRPAGDAILNRRAVSDPAFGCRFTVGERAAFGAPCPA